MGERKYERLVYQFKPEYNEAAAEGVGTDYVVSPQAYFRGACQIPGAQYNVGFQIFTKPFFLDRIPHIHPVEEYLSRMYLNLTLKYHSAWVKRRKNI